jgi:hypothetical protein
MDQEFGKVHEEILILENGSMGKLMVMGFILGSMEIDMKDNLNNA